MNVHYLKSTPFKTFAAWLLLLLFSFPSAGQAFREIIEKANTRNFREIQRLVENYYADKSKGKGSGYKQWKRWEYFYKSRLDENGNVVNIARIQYEQANALRSRRSNQRIVSTNPGNWQRLGPVQHELSNWLGRINYIVVDPANSSIIYVGAPSGGLWRSIDDGKTWTCLTESVSSTVGVSGIQIDPASPPANRTIYIHTGDRDAGDANGIGLLRSIDNGNTWSKMNFPFEDGRRFRMHPTNGQVLFFSSLSAIYKSTDGGNTWTSKVAGYWDDLEFHPTNPSIMYAVGHTGGIRSTNGGETWQAMTGLPRNPHRLDLAVTPANPSYTFA